MTMKWNETEKKQLAIFLLTAFGLPILMGIVMGISYFHGNDVSAFALAQMFYPAAGVILAMFLTKKKDPVLPKKFYIGFLVATVVSILTAIASAIFPQFPWAVLSQLPVILFSIVLFILLLVEKKEVRSSYGLSFSGKPNSKPVLYMLLFFVLYLLRLFLSSILEGDISGFSDTFKNPMTYFMIANLVISFFLSFSAFLGEEYGWRFFLQPLFQKRFGLKGGVLLLGLIWGLWHLPLNLFYYSPDTWFISVVLQLITCISLAIFFGYGYLKTQNIWVPVVMHYINNNMITVLTGSADLSGRVYHWIDIPISLLINFVFILFLFSDVYRRKKTTGSF